MPTQPPADKPRRTTLDEHDGLLYEAVLDDTDQGHHYEITRRYGQRLLANWRTNDAIIADALWLHLVTRPA